MNTKKHLNKKIVQRLIEDYKISQIPTLPTINVHCGLCRCTNEGTCGMCEYPVGYRR